MSTTSATSAAKASTKGIIATNLRLPVSPTSAPIVIIVSAMMPMSAVQTLLGIRLRSGQSFFVHIKYVIDGLDH
jgi:hypothetical protein